MSDFNDEEKDVKAAYMLLGGTTITDSNGLPQQIYFENYTVDDREARKAIARLLSNGKPLDSQIRHYLAALFDNDAFYFQTKGAKTYGVQEFYVDRRI